MKLGDEAARALILRSYTYEPETGHFRATTNRPHRKAVDICGTPSEWGYINLRAGDVRMFAHRAAWLVVYGTSAPGVIDHINGIKTDNRIANLRCVSDRVNAENKRVARVDNVTGLLGVSPCRSGYRAILHVRGKQHYLGAYKTPEEAHAVYVEKKRQLHEGNTL